MPIYDEDQARQAVEQSFSYAEALRRLGLRPSGGNHRLFRRHIDEVWMISTDHFDRAGAQRLGVSRRGIPLQQVLVEGSSYSRTALKRRLFDSGLKERRCELCGQDEVWRGGRMSMILDHINGVPDDNRVENLRIVCPNCAATFETHCGRKNRLPLRIRECARCGQQFSPHSADQRYCSRDCGCRHTNRPRTPSMFTRKVERPPYEQLIGETNECGFSAVGRKYGVSGNAVRKWIRWYEAAAQTEEVRRDAA